MKFYTRRPVTNSDGIVPILATSTVPPTSGSTQAESDDTSTLWCYCNQPSFGDKILCVVPRSVDITTTLAHCVSLANMAIISLTVYHSYNTLSCVTC